MNASEHTHKCMHDDMLCTQFRNNAENEGLTGDWWDSLFAQGIQEQCFCIATTLLDQVLTIQLMVVSTIQQ